jgi:hypothetical protein
MTKTPHQILTALSLTVFATSAQAGGLDDTFMEREPIHAATQASATDRGDIIVALIFFALLAAALGGAGGGAGAPPVVVIPVL